MEEGLDPTYPDYKGLSVRTRAASGPLQRYSNTFEVSQPSR